MQKTISKEPTPIVKTKSLKSWILLFSAIILVLSAVLYLASKEDVPSSSLDIKTKQQIIDDKRNSYFLWAEHNRKMEDVNEWMKEEMKKVYSIPLMKLSTLEEREEVLRSGILVEEYAKLFQDPTSITFDSEFIKEVDRKIEKVARLKQLSGNAVNYFEKRMRDTFVYNSNAIEGNQLSWDQTWQILENGELSNIKKVKVKDIIEVRNHGEAFSELLTQAAHNRTIDLTIIKRWHKILMNSLIGNAGEFRTHGVGIGGKKTLLAHYLELSSLMEKLIDYINSPQFTDSHPIAQACLVHYNFVKIHGFSDGNGRLTRLLMNLILLRSKLPLTIIQHEDDQFYFNTIDEHRSNGPESQSPLCNFIAKAVDSALDQYLGHFRMEQFLGKI